MLTGLDPHSSYMNAKAFKDMQIQTKGEFGGLGIEVNEDKGLIKVVSPIDDTPAARGGIKPGDIITALDGKTVIGLSLNDAVDRMRGPPNSKIVLTIKRQNVEKPIEISLTRETIHLQVVKSRMEPDNIGYIRLSQFTEQADAGIKQAVHNLKQQSGGKLARTGARPAQQSGWPARSGGCRVIGFRRPGGDRLHPRPASG